MMKANFNSIPGHESVRTTLPNECAPYDVNAATEVNDADEEQLLPTAFAPAVNVDFTFAYMAFLVNGSETSGRSAVGPDSYFLATGEPAASMDLPESATRLKLDWMLPGIAPTGKRVECATVGIIQFRDGKLLSEHLYWDQASVLVQLGLLHSSKLPVTGVETARKVADPTLPSNRIMARAAYMRAS